MNPNADHTFWITVTSVMSVLFLLIAIFRLKSGTQKNKLALLATLVGGIGFIELYPVSKLIPLSVEMPIIWTDVDIALDRLGNVYVASNNWRVQKYDNSGNFLFAIMPDDAGGKFGIALTDDDELQIESLRERAVDYFSSEGVYLKRRKSDDMALLSVLEPVTATTVWPYKAYFDPRQRVVMIEDIHTGKITKTANFSFLWLLVLNPFSWWAIGVAGILIGLKYEPKQKRWIDLLRNTNIPEK